MPTITASGIGSGLDVASIVSQLVAAERSPQDTRLNTRQNLAQVQLSALGSFKSALTTLDTALDALNGSALTAQTATVSDPTLFSASASGASAGTFNVEVRALARANKQASDAYASSASVVGNGTVTLTVAGESFSVTLADGSNTLGDLRDAINSAGDNTGVSAAIVNDSGQARLVLTAQNTGLANAVSVTSAAAPLLPILPPGPPFINWTQTQTALDAELRVDGYTTTSASNQITDALSGVTFNLLRAAPGTVATLSIGSDNASMKTAVQKFVEAYNAYVQSHRSLTKYDASTRTAAALNGDPALRSLNQSLRSISGGEGGAGSSFDYLSQLGIKGSTDGTLTLDTAKLDAALAADPAGVKNLFTGTGGFATRMGSVVSNYLGSGGQYENATSTLQERLRDIAERREALDTRMESIELRYRAQFTRLDTLISQLKTTSDYLTQQLSSLSANSR